MTCHGNCLVSFLLLSWRIWLERSVSLLLWKTDCHFQTMFSYISLFFCSNILVGSLKTLSSIDISEVSVKKEKKRISWVLDDILTAVNIFLCKWTFLGASQYPVLCLLRRMSILNNKKKVHLLQIKLGYHYLSFWVWSSLNMLFFTDEHEIRLLTSNNSSESWLILLLNIRTQWLKVIKLCWGEHCVWHFTINIRHIAKI